MTTSMTAPGRLAVIGVAHPFRGGISHYSTLLVRSLRERYEVDFITLRRQYPALLFPGRTQYDTSERALVEPNEPIIDSLNPVTWLRAARRLNRAAPRLVIVQWWHPFFAPAFGTMIRLLDADLKRRVCFLCHNVLPHEATPLARALTRYAFGPAPFFIVHSEQDRQALADLRPGAVIRKGTHATYSEFSGADVYDKRAARAALGIAEDRDTILFFGLVREYKGLAHLIRAMKTVASRIDCLLLVAGEFYDDKRPYLELVEAEGLAAHVRIVDRYIPNEEVACYFAAADVAVLPYTSATQSGIVQIAFGLGLPVITTDVGGLPEVVDHRKTGLIVEAGKPERLAEAILEYYDQGYEAGFREEIARQSSRFDWSEEIKHIEAFVDAQAIQSDSALEER